MITLAKKPAPKPLLLIILDGFGVSLERTGNPVMEASTPMLDELWANFPAATLQASGIGVGLPWGKAGNSEVGHMTIGAGKIIYSHLPRIENAIHDGTFDDTPAFKKAIAHARKNNSRLHIAGLTGNGTVHSYRNHLHALLALAEKSGIEHIFVHAFTDGKDSPPISGAHYLLDLEVQMKDKWPHSQIATVVGRACALDRDENWNQTKIAYELMTKGKGERADSASSWARDSYKKGVTDAFLAPAVIAPEGTIQAGDTLFFFDFREDSMRQIVSAFALDSFDKFPRGKIDNLFIVTMTQYK